jgi:hypothetical protein
VSLVLDPIDQSRYLTSAKAAVVKFLNHYINLVPYASHWEGVGGGVQVLTATAGAAMKPKQRLDQPVLFVKLADEEVDYTTAPQGQFLHRGEWHKLTFELEAITDGRTGRGVTRDDVASAVGKILAEHRSDLIEAGMAIMGFGGVVETEDPQRNLFSHQKTLRLDLMVYGAVVRTLVQELGHFLVTSAAGGEFTPGAVLDLVEVGGHDVGHDLQVEVLTSIRSTTAVQVTAKNQSGNVGTLTTTLPEDTRAKSIVDLEPLVANDTFLEVTAVQVSNGTAGDAFRILNKSIELEE